MQLYSLIKCLLDVKAYTSCESTVQSKDKPFNWILTRAKDYTNLKPHYLHDARSMILYLIINYNIISFTQHISILHCVTSYAMLETHNTVHKSVNNALHYHLVNITDKTIYGITYLQYAIFTL